MPKLNTDQKIFDYVATHLLAQGKRSVDTGTNFCMYRNPNGLKCAVGCLIGDAHYDPRMEGKTIPSSFVRKALEESGIELYASTLYLLEDLQRIHDTVDSSQWLAALHVCAVSRSLNVSLLPPIPPSVNEPCPT